MAVKGLDRLESTLRQALSQAGKILVRNFGKARIRYKGRGNLVTQVDHASEQAILNIILKRYPGHDFLTEERPAKLLGSEYTWIIDPVDGTTNYAHSYPMSCISIGLAYRRRPLLGGVLDPFRKELFLAVAGRGARVNGRKLQVSRTSKLEESLLVTGFPYDRGERARFYVEFYRTFMEKSHDVRRSGSAALDLAWVAAGRADAFWEFQLQPWDAAAGRLLIEEAGGRVTDFSGRPWDRPETWGQQTVASNGRIHAQLLKVFRLPKPWRAQGAIASFRPK